MYDVVQFAPLPTPSLSSLSRSLSPTRLLLESLEAPRGCSGVSLIRSVEVEKMNRCSGYYQPSATATSGAVVCPTPRRIALLNPSISSGLPYLTEIPDSRAGMELLDTIFAKGSYGVEKSNIQEASSPPLFCGSPPSRASNPLIQDSQFGNYGFCSSRQAAILSTSPSSACIVGSRNQMKFGNKPAVRIEGFDCIDRDNRSVFVVA